MMTAYQAADEFLASLGPCLTVVQAPIKQEEEIGQVPPHRLAQLNELLWTTDIKRSRSPSPVLYRSESEGNVEELRNVGCDMRSQASGKSNAQRPAALDMWEGHHTGHEVMETAGMQTRQATTIETDTPRNTLPASGRRYIDITSNNPDQASTSRELGQETTVDEGGQCLNRPSSAEMLEPHIKMELED
jgi:hypothetical protein